MPIAGVRIDNRINTVLLAVKILRAFDVRVQREVEEFVKGAKEESLKLKGSRLRSPHGRCIINRGEASLRLDGYCVSSFLEDINDFF